MPYAFLMFADNSAVPHDPIRGAPLSAATSGSRNVPKGTKRSYESDLNILKGRWVCEIFPLICLQRGSTGYQWVVRRWRPKKSALEGRQHRKPHNQNRRCISTRDSVNVLFGNTFCLTTAEGCRKLCVVCWTSTTVLRECGETPPT